MGLDEVGQAGLEPARGYPQRILSPLCLPFHHCPEVFAVVGMRLRLQHITWLGGDTSLRAWGSGQCFRHVNW